jgi:hypothetical protein
LNDQFSFLVDRPLSTEEIVLWANALVAAYPADLEEAFNDEFLLSLHLYAEKKTVEDFLKAQISYKLINSFPNVYIALRMYLAFLGMNCEGECSFLKLKLIKKLSPINHGITTLVFPCTALY